jgi:MraZ protein
VAFRGSFNHTIDNKGRVIIPAKFREEIEATGDNNLILTTFDGCVRAYPLDAWKEIEEKINSVKETDTGMRRFRRIFIGNAFENSFDRQGRLLIPPKLKQDAELEKDVVMLGQLKFFEIWDRENYEQEESKLIKDLKDEEVRRGIAQLQL